MGFDKIMTLLGDRPLLLHTLERIQQTGCVTEVVLVVRQEIVEEVATMVEPWQSFCSIKVISGGVNRQDSVAAGLSAVTPDAQYVMIHDAARIFVTTELITSVLAAAQEVGAAAAATPCSDSLKQAKADGLVQKTLDRSEIWALQTPQIFEKQLLLDCYKKALPSGVLFTDDTAVVEFCGHPVKLVHYKGVNFKVTTPADWKLAIAQIYMCEPDSPPGQQLRKYIHDLNNHLTPLMGYGFLIMKELKDGPNGEKFARNIQSASERCQGVAVEMQKLVRQLFPRRDEENGNHF
jgi:2-C-methyl-D-erythritol 4-phosphate cytidylyltransferase